LTLKLERGEREMMFYNEGKKTLIDIYFPTMKLAFLFLELMGSIYLGVPFRSFFLFILPKKSRLYFKILS
jgi:hypothetical protein